MGGWAGWTDPASDKTRDFSVLIRGGTLYDGSGSAGRIADLGIQGDRIVALGDLEHRSGALEIDAKGLAVAPGFINMLSWAVDTLIEDGRSQSDIRQGVTLEVFGEGSSMGPMNDSMKAYAVRHQGDIHFPIEWTTLGEYLDYLAAKGVSPNVASFVGASTVRVHELGRENRSATPAELKRMQDLVRQAMREGALGVASALIYAPGSYASTEELIALSRAAGESGGRYISHLRSEGDRLLEAIDELIQISRAAGVGGEIYHLKMSGRRNWGKFDAVIRKVEAARASGLDISANMYSYTAGSTGLDAAMPLWVQEGGYDAWARRLRDPEIRRRVAREMRDPEASWENFFLQAGPEKMLLVGFRNPALKPLTGKTLAAVAALRGTTPAETAMDLVVEDGSRVSVVYFLMSEENVARQMSLPWMSFDSDAGSQAPAGVFLKSSTHPRAYGSFARIFAKYIREEKALSLSEAIRRLTAFPAENLKIRQRGRLEPGYFADVVIFDPRTIQDHATYAQPQVYATGVRDVFVNGVQVLRDGEHTGALPGRVVRGPGWNPER